MKIGDDFIEILKKGGVALFLRILGFIAGYLFVYYTVHFFGAETLGRAQLSFSILMIASLFCILGSDVNYVKLFAIENNFDNAKGLFIKAYPIFIGGALFLGAILFVFSSWISEQVFNDPALSPFLKWTAPGIVLYTLILINASVFRGIRKNTLYAFLFNGGRFIFTLFFFTVLMFFWTKDPIITIAAHTLALGALFLISLRYLYKYLHPFSKKTSYKVNHFIKDSFPMFLSASMIVLLGWSDTIILGIYEESSVVGRYSVALKIAVVVSFSLQAVDSILAPKLSHAFHENNILLFKQLIKFSTIINAIFSTVAIIGIIFFKEFILNIFGPDFLQVSTALLFLCVGQFFNSIIGPVGSIFQMTGHQKVFQNILIISFIINLILNLALVQTYGINGVAFSTAFSLIFSKLVSAFYVKKLIWNRV
ncbi:MAG: flippase [Flavobacteriales bacterium]|jgi:O-antigen/teichoic acid export membrane protein|tara:strand:+ start:141 stop:1409 length:1269 start_codon:yes stop_codon:yes gene_type:complete